MIHPLRVAVTGTEIGFGLYDTLELIGKEKCLDRLEKIIIQWVHYVLVEQVYVHDLQVI